jgi:hypothetical protein
MTDGRARAEIAELRAENEKWRAERDPRTTGAMSYKAGRKRKEPDWVVAGVRIAQTVREGDPGISSKDISDTIWDRCKDMNCPEAERTRLHHIARWEAEGLVPRKAK